MKDWEIKINNITIYQSCSLLCDDYVVTFQSLITGRKIVINFFVDGQWKGEYMNPDNEIGNKFGCPKYMRHPLKYIQMVRQLNGKKASEALKKERKHILNSPSWNSPRSLIRHLNKTCKSIKIIQ